MRLPLVLGLVLALAGCGGSNGSGPVALPPVTGAPSASPTATPVSGVGLQETPADAEKFARLFFEAFNTAYATMNPQPIAELSAPGCQACQGYTSDLTRTKAEGQTYAGGTIHILNLAASPLMNDVTDVIVQYALEDLTLVAPDGQRSVAVPGATSQVVSLSVGWAEGRWHVNEVTRT